LESLLWGCEKRTTVVTKVLLTPLDLCTECLVETLHTSVEVRHERAVGLIVALIALVVVVVVAEFRQ
jgi:hypothetical protein